MAHMFGISSLKVLKELSFPEYRARHIFIAKLRIAIFLGFWFLYVLFLKGHLSETKPVTITILICFLVTTICYYNIFNDKYLVPSFFFEIISDLIAMTAIIYLTGGASSEYYIIYIFYAMGTGLFYNFRLALFVAILSYLSYALFIMFIRLEAIPPLFEGYLVPVDLRMRFSYLYPLLLAVFLALAVYATHIAHLFTQRRERLLLARNKELLALQHMSSTIRTVTSLDSVLKHVASGVLEGLNLIMCLLMIRDSEEGRIKCISPEGTPVIDDVEKILGIKLRDLHIPLASSEENTALEQLRQGKIIFRRDIVEVVDGLKPDISKEKYKEVQEKLGINRVIAIPLVTGREVIGSLIGFTTEAFVESDVVHTFQAFADQAALTVEAAMLISELRKKNMALMEANKVKSEFLATMSHELRTPLTAIIGFSELLVERVMGALTEEQDDSLKEVLNNANNLLEMINNILDLAKVDSGKMELIKQSFDWGSMVRRVERSMVSLVQKKNHTLSLDIPKDIPSVYADEKRMQQVIINLLSNAVKFTPENGSINIKTNYYKSLDVLDVPNKDSFEVNQFAFESGLVLCEVVDSGIGIPKKHIPFVFNIFQQVDSSVTKSYEGTGLGLALVKQFVELHGGHVWAESKEGVGTKFSFIIPV